MANPVFARGFRAPEPAPVPVQQGGYEQPQWNQNSMPPQATSAEPVMTFDDVVTKSAVSLGAMMIVAAVAFMLLPLNSSTFLVTGGAALVGFVLAIVVAMRRTVTPLMAIAYAVVEGVFVGGFSKAFETMYPGIVGQAVLGTFVTAGLVLAAYKFFNIRLGSKFRTGLLIGTAAYAGAMLLNFGLSFAGINLGLVDGIGQFSALGAIMLGVGTILAVLNLLSDFDYIRWGIEQRVPASESWRAAFGLTVTLVWLYINILRILSYLRN